MRRLAIVPLLVLAACGGATRAPRAAAGEAAFAELRDRIARDLWDFRPNEAMKLGLHDYDGRLPDRSAAALEAARGRFHADLEALDRVPPGGPAVQRQELGALRGALRSNLFELEGTRAPWRNPFHYLRALNLLDYVSRDYAPLPERARAVIRYVEAARPLLAAARANLSSGPMPRAWVELGVGMAGGAAQFADVDARKILVAVDDEALRRDVGAALDAHVAELKAFRDYLASRRADAGNDFALGPALYLRMLADVEGVTTDLPTLERVAKEDIVRNIAALDEAARQIDPQKTTKEVVAQVLDDIPPVADLVTVARAQVAEARAFVARGTVVGIPSEEQAEVALSPPFMRSNPAFLSSAGALETRSLPSFYFIAPPDPSWPPEQQRTYVPARPSLAFITVHEVWPGHFLQDLYLMKHPSRVVRSFCSFAFTEGWAHYAEEMMWEAGFGGGDPRMHIGQLQQALMRDARFLASLGLHTKGISVEDATRLFQDIAFMPPSSARQQAVRGTGDPLYLTYTLGKLMIKKLRDDWKAKVGAGATLRGFHEALLSAGCQSVPVMREALVGGGEAL